MSPNEPGRTEAENLGTIGPFQLSSTLGHGGMGVVYRAEHRDTGAQVALKTVTAATPAVVSAIRREIRALARLHHPGIVRIVGSGVHEGLPWYAMDLLHGYTLRDYLLPVRSAAAAGTAAPMRGTHAARTDADEQQLVPTSSIRIVPPRRLTQRPPLELIASMCKALAHLHENGIVHRDLKPENIFVQADGPPVLVDLGISAEFAGSRGREELDGAWSARLGTLAYMAPEQIRGELVDARADLYAVGCILYECVTGRRVFIDTDPHALREAHLHTRPTAPSKLVELPEELDQLILQLLEKDPEDRLGYADDVARLLTTLTTNEDSASSTPAQYLHRPRFVGREEILDRLRAAIHRLDRDSTGGVWLLSGESGVGKTRIANEAVFEATQTNLDVVLGQCASVVVGVDAHSDDTPLRAFTTLFLAIADECRQNFAADTERLLGVDGRLLATYQPAFFDVPGFETLPEPERGEGPEARRRVLTAAAKAILNFAALKPTLLVIDDLQWADELSLALLRMLAERGLTESGLLVFGTHRAEETGVALRQLANLSQVQRVALERFAPSDVRVMVQGMLALRRAEEPLVDYLASHSNGNPFFIVEHLRTAIAEGLLARDDRGRWTLTGKWRFDEAAPLPRTLADLIKRRLAHIGPEAKRLVEAAAVLGRQFELRLVEESARDEASTDSEGWSVLREKQIIEEHEVGSFRFVHDGLREAAYAQLDAVQLESLHARAARAIEITYTEETRAPYYADLAHHHSKSRNTRAAASYFRLAGDRARNAFATSAAVRHFRSAFAELGKNEDETSAESRAEIQEILADLLLFEGDAAEAQLNIEAAIVVSASHGAGVHARRLRKLARVMERQHRHADALETYYRAERELGAPPADENTAAAHEYWHEFVQIQVDCAGDLYFMARVDELDALVARAQHVVERYGTPAQRSRFFTSIAQSLAKRARLKVTKKALHFTELALAVGDKSSDPRERAVAHFAHAFPLALYGDYAAAESLFVQALAGAERVGDSALITRVLAYFGVLLRRTERPSEARAVSERAMRLARIANMYDYIGVSQANLAWVCSRENDAEGCILNATGALEAWSKLPAAYVFPMQWLARLPYAQQLSNAGQRGLAAEQLKFLLRDDQMALNDSLVAEIECGTARLEQGEDSALDGVWPLCRSANYL